MHQPGNNEQAGSAGRQALEHADTHTHLHPFLVVSDSAPATSRIISRASGVHVYGTDGHEYLDAGGGLWFTAIGYGRGEIADVLVAAGAPPLTLTADQADEIVTRLSRALDRLVELL